MEHHPSIYSNPRSQLPPNWPYPDYKPSRFERTLRFMYRHRAGIGSVATTAALLAVLYAGAQNQTNQATPLKQAETVDNPTQIDEPESFVPPAEADATINGGPQPDDYLNGAAIGSAFVACGVVLAAWAISRGQYKNNDGSPAVATEICQDLVNRGTES